MILATTEAARRFAEQYRAELFPAAPIVFIDRVMSADRAPDSTGISTFDRFYERLARAQLKRFAGRVSLTFWSDLSLAELERRAATLPPKSVIYFLTLGEDGAGARFISVDVREQLSAVANAPIYSWHQVAMNHGVLGGHLYSNEIVAERSAEIALRILRGEKASDSPVTAVDSMVTLLDSRELQRWKIPASRVPAGAVVMFRDPTLWDRYKGYISGAIALFAVQSALIALLLVQRTRRRRAENEMRDHQSMLEASNRQITDLFGRLIAAQENQAHPHRARSSRQRQSANCRFSSAPDLGPIREDAALCLYRVTQEALHNVAKHAGATEVSVSLSQDENVLRLSIVDDGKGFNLAGARQRRGLGLISIDERARLLGGQVAIDTKPGGGTRIEVRLPNAGPGRLAQAPA